MCIVLSFFHVPKYQSSNNQENIWLFNTTQSIHDVDGRILMHLSKQNDQQNLIFSSSSSTSIAAKTKSGLKRLFLLDPWFLWEKWKFTKNKNNKYCNHSFRKKKFSLEKKFCLIILKRSHRVLTNPTITCSPSTDAPLISCLLSTNFTRPVLSIFIKYHKACVTVPHAPNISFKETKKFVPKQGIWCARDIFGKSKNADFFFCGDWGRWAKSLLPKEIMKISPVISVYNSRTCLLDGGKKLNLLEH